MGWDEMRWDRKQTLITPRIEWNETKWNEIE